MKKLRKFSLNRSVVKNELAILSSIYPPDSGGPATFAAAFKSFLYEKNVTSTVISYCDSESQFYTELKGSVRLITRKNMPAVRIFIMVFQIWKLSVRRIPILANGCFVELAIATFFTPRNFNVKIPGDIVWERASSSGLVSCSVHEFQSQRLPFKFKLLRFFFNLSLRRANVVLVPAPYLIDLAISWGVNPKRIVLIYNSVDVDVFRPMDLPKKYDVISVSRLVPVKNIGETIECCARLKLKLLIVGDGPLMDELQNLAKNLGANATFVGSASQNDLPIFYNESRCMVLNSSLEATSYSLIEARACGLPTIANLGTGATEIIAHQTDGFLCGESTGETLEKALRKLSKDTELAALMGTNARRDTIERFNRAKLFERILGYSIPGET